MTCFDLFFLEKGQQAREHAHAVFDRVDAEVFAFGVEAATGRAVMTAGAVLRAAAAAADPRN